MATHTITQTWSNGSTPVSQQVSVTGEGEHNFDVPLTAPTADLEVAVVLAVARMKSAFLTCDVACTIEANTAATPAFTVTLAANSPVVWYVGSGLTNPFTVDVTKLFISSTAAGTLKMRFLVDATP